MNKTRVGRGAAIILILVLLSMTVSTGAWAIWSMSSTSGSNGVAQATTVGAGSTPTVVADGSSMIVTWTASTLATGTPVSGYLVNRYSASFTAQVVVSNCAGMITNLGCIENNVPAGTWYYSVTPVFATNWKGAESSLSTPSVSTGIAPTNTVWMWVTP